MTDDQFNLLVEVLRMTSEPTIEAARLHLLNGETQANAARKVGFKHTNHLSVSIAKIKDLHEKINSCYK